MSLINEALKKAQKQRSGEAPALASMPTIGGEAPRRIARHSGSPGVGGLLLKIGAGAGGLVLVVLAGVFLLRDKPSPAPGATVVQTAPTSTPATTASAPAAESRPAPTVATPASKPADNAFVLPIAAPPEPTKAATVPPKGEPRAEATRPATKPQEEPAVAAAKPSAEPPARLEPRAMDFIDGIRVAGIRASATDAKVLMNDRVYRVGDTVEREMGLRLIGITANSLTFEDERGGRYTRNF